MPCFLRRFLERTGRAAMCWVRAYPRQKAQPEPCRDLPVRHTRTASAALDLTARRPAAPDKPRPGPDARASTGGTAGAGPIFSVNHVGIPGRFLVKQVSHSFEYPKPCRPPVHVPGFEHRVSPYGGEDGSFVPMSLDELAGGAVDI